MSVHKDIWTRETSWKCSLFYQHTGTHYHFERSQCKSFP